MSGSRAGGAGCPLKETNARSRARVADRRPSISVGRPWPPWRRASSMSMWRPACVVQPDRAGRPAGGRLVIVLGEIAPRWASCFSLRPFEPAQFAGDGFGIDRRLGYLGHPDAPPRRRPARQVRRRRRDTRRSPAGRQRPGCSPAAAPNWSRRSMRSDGAATWARSGAASVSGSAASRASSRAEKMGVGPRGHVAHPASGGDSVG